MPNNAVKQARERRNERADDRPGRDLDPESLDNLERVIREVDDESTRDALRELAHLVSGDDRFDRR